MRPIVDGLEAGYGQQISFRRINANEGDGPAIMRAYRIPGHPTTLVYDTTGQEVERFIGPQPAEKVETALKATLKIEP